jgi:hypothetical protein
MQGAPSVRRFPPGKRLQHQSLSHDTNCTSAPGRQSKIELSSPGWNRTDAQKGRRLDFFASSFYGFFFGFALGVGCWLVVLYAIYSGGYRKALEDSLRNPNSDHYRRLLAKAKQKVAAEPTPDR